MPWSSSDHWRELFLLQGASFGCASNNGVVVYMKTVLVDDEIINRKHPTVATSRIVRTVLHCSRTLTF
jgi:hypothetical protein